jgi:hypothetical protein
MLISPCWVCFYVKNSMYAQIYACFMNLLISSQMYILIFKTCPSMINICTTISLYVKSFDIQISRVSKSFSTQKDRTCPPPLSDISGLRHWKTLSLKSRTCLAPGPDISDAWAKGYKKGVHTPSNPNSSTSSPLHLWWLQGLPRRFGDSSNEPLGFLGDSSPLSLDFFKH